MIYEFTVRYSKKMPVPGVQYSSEEYSMEVTVDMRPYGDTIPLHKHIETTFEDVKAYVDQQFEHPDDQTEDGLTLR